MSLKIRYHSREYSWLCFHHATQEVFKDVEVTSEIGDFDEYYTGTTPCVICSKENLISEYFYLVIGRNADAKELSCILKNFPLELSFERLEWEDETIENFKKWLDENKELILIK